MACLHFISQMQKLLPSAIMLWVLQTPLAFSQTKMTGGDPYANLKVAVQFWELVFSGFNNSYCIIHDRDDLSMIYVAKKLSGSTPQEQLFSSQRYMRAIEKALLSLSAQEPPANRLMQRIITITPPHKRNSQSYRVAANNLRCQRGVDFQPALARAQRYLPMIQNHLKRRGMPLEIAYLPILESGYEVRAVSHAGAKGLWQLMPGTARSLGLRVDRFIDQRLDPQASTQAALQYLKGLHDKFGSWPLAITAYNYGENGLARAVKRFGRNLDTIREYHQTKIFGFAAKNYYASFIALRNVVNRNSPQPSIQNPSSQTGAVVAVSKDRSSKPRSF
jgi:membrane-bound lytic murein transglycosylase D